MIARCGGKKLGFKQEAMRGHTMARVALAKAARGGAEVEIAEEVWVLSRRVVVEVAEEVRVLWRSVVVVRTNKEKKPSIV